LIEFLSLVCWWWNQRNVFFIRA